MTKRADQGTSLCRSIQKRLNEEKPACIKEKEKDAFVLQTENQEKPNDENVKGFEMLCKNKCNIQTLIERKVLTEI